MSLVRQLLSEDGMFQHRACWSRIVSTSALLAVVVAGGSLWVATPASAAKQRRAAAKQQPKDLSASFQDFCKQWMEKVWTREGRHSITWEKDGDAVFRTYVEYSREYNCTLTEDKPPVGKINYRETWYEKRGKSIADAEASPAQPIKIFETGEFFSYDHGKWAY